MWKLRGKTEQSLSDAFRRQSTFSHRQMTSTSTLARSPARKTGARPQFRPRMMRSSAWGEPGRRRGPPRTCRVMRCCEQLYSWRQAGDGKDAGAVLCMRPQLHRTQAGKQFQPCYAIPAIVDKKFCRRTVVYYEMTGIKAVEGLRRKLSRSISIVVQSAEGCLLCDGFSQQNYLP